MSIPDIDKISANIMLSHLGVFQSLYSVMPTTMRVSDVFWSTLKEDPEFIRDFTAEEDETKIAQGKLGMVRIQSYELRVETSANLVPKQGDKELVDMQLESDDGKTMDVLLGL